MQEFKVKLRTLLGIFLAVFGVGLVCWIMYLANYAYFCQWHFEDSEARFLVLGDPQMEGDSRVSRQGLYGQVDLMYNDAYFRHMVSNIMKYLAPTHVFVLGDLFSSQYVSDQEFQVRAQRYERIFESVTVPLYNITGNHDLGYAGEVNSHRVQRFEKVFGKVNDEIIIADHVIGIVNSLNIDASADKDIHRQAWEHMRNLTESSQARNMPLIMMTHIPLHKESYTPKNNENIYTRQRKLEVCGDRSYTKMNKNGHIDEQNMLQPESSKTILEDIKPSFIFNGHDHEGCIYRHNEQTVEYTVRSMMGGYGGYAGLFEIRRNPASDPQPFSYYYTPCSFVGTPTTTITFIVAVVYVFVVTSVVLMYTVAVPQEKQFQYQKEYAARYMEEFHEFVKAKSA